MILTFIHKKYAEWTFTGIEFLLCKRSRIWQVLIKTSKVCTKIVQRSLVEKMQFRVRVLPEHQVCSSRTFLCRLWPNMQFWLTFSSHNSKYSRFENTSTKSNNYKHSNIHHDDHQHQHSSHQ